MATKKVQKKKAKATLAGGLSPVVDEDYQGYVFGLYPEWGTYPGSGDEVPGIPFEEAKNASCVRARGQAPAGASVGMDASTSARAGASASATTGAGEPARCAAIGAGRAPDSAPERPQRPRARARNASLTPAAAHLAPPPPARLPAPVHRSEVIHGFAMPGVTGAWAQENPGEGPVRRWSVHAVACEINYLGQEAFGNTPNAFVIIVVVEILTRLRRGLRTGVVDFAFPELTQGDAYPSGRFDPSTSWGQPGGACSRSSSTAAWPCSAGRPHRAGRRHQAGPDRQLVGARLGPCCRQHRQRLPEPPFYLRPHRPARLLPLTKMLA